jgi:hypothetical protein
VILGEASLERRSTAVDVSVRRTLPTSARRWISQPSDPHFLVDAADALAELLAEVQVCAHTCDPEDCEEA